MNSLPLRDATLHSSGLQNGFAYPAPYELRPPNSAGGSPSMLRPSITPLYRYRNINLSSIDYAFRPRLRSRLTQSGRTFLWKPWVFGAWDSHPRSATHTGILSSIRSSAPSDTPSPHIERSPTTCLRKSIASVIYLAPVNYRRRVIRLVSCYALFKGWLLLSQPPSCLYISTSFSA